MSQLFPGWLPSTLSLWLDDRLASITPIRESFGMFLWGLDSPRSSQSRQGQLRPRNVPRLVRCNFVSADALIRIALQCGVNSPQRNGFTNSPDESAGARTRSAHSDRSCGNALASSAAKGMNANVGESMREAVGSTRIALEHHRIY